MKTSKIALFIIISGYSIANHSMSTNRFLQFNPVNRILSLFARQSTQQPAQNIAPVATPAPVVIQAPVIQKKYPHPIPYSQHTVIRSINSFQHGLSLHEWEQEANQIARSIMQEQESFYSFNIWCKRLKADAYKQAKLQNNPQPNLAVPTERPSIVFAQLIAGSRPLIKNPRQQ